MNHNTEINQNDARYVELEGVRFRRARIVNGKEVSADEAATVMPASAALRLLGIYQYGDLRHQMRKLGVPVVGLGGMNGGMFLVRTADVLALRAQREKSSLADMFAAKEQEAAPVEAAPVEAAPVEAEVETPAALMREMLTRMSRLEGKMDRLLAMWEGA